MSDQSGDTPFAGFMDDYFAEADEHLSIIRRKLIMLEQCVRKNTPTDSGVFNDLFRSFHTLKGLSAMVGLEAAETLAHHTENLLRQVVQKEITLTQEGLNSLVHATRTMEAVISARRNETDISGTDAAIQMLQGQQKAATESEPSNDSPPEASKDTPALPASEPVTQGLNHRTIWRFTFVPSKELSRKGIDVNAIRTRLEQVGEILQTAPQLTKEGHISFEFIAKNDRSEKDFSGWADEGLTWEPYQKQDSKPRRTSDGETSAFSQSAPAPPLPDTILSVTPSNVVRVDLKRLDELMKRVGDLVISRSRLESQVRQLEDSLTSNQFNGLQETHATLERQLRDLREGIMRLRMVPMGDIFNRMQFVVQDLAPKSRKKVVLKTEGKDTEIDKFLVERMMDPLLHLVRNALTHGLETEDERLTAGKPAEGTLTLKSFTEGDAVIIEVADDGRGIDVTAVLDRARETGLIEKDADSRPKDVLDLICRPSFSTRKEADLGSGRGVGMGVVSQTVQDLGGFLDFSSEPGKGTCFSVRLPLTLAIVDAFIVSVGEHIFAVPQPTVREVISFKQDQLTEMENNVLLSYRGNALPIIRLSDLFRIPENGSRAALVVGEGLHSAGMAVDRVLTKREIVVRTLDDPLVMSPGIIGATELGDGKALMILDPKELIKKVVGEQLSVVGSRLSVEQNRQPITDNR